MWVSTFHSACVRILRRDHELAGLQSAFSIYDTADSVNLMKLVMKELDLDPKKFTAKALLGRVGHIQGRADRPGRRAAAADGGRVALLASTTPRAEAYGAYQARLEAANAVDFDDIIVKTVRLLQDHPEVAARYRERFRHVLVDEYQDTNHAQYVLVRELVGPDDADAANLTVVGDADQSIYAFRGASIRNILEFEKDYPDAHIIRLEQNYRSTQNILSAANAVIANNAGRPPKNLWTDAGAGERIVGYAARHGAGRGRSSSPTRSSSLTDGRDRGAQPTSPSCTAPTPSRAPSRSASFAPRSRTRWWAARASTSAARSRTCSPTSPPS